MDGNIYDPVFSPDGKKILFVCDAGDRFELYELDLAASRIFRLTRTIGGNFTPAYSPEGKQILFSSFRNGSMNVYGGAQENFRYEAVGSYKSPAISNSARTFTSVVPSTGTYRSYKFRASTDLFFPAFIFSSPGGLFWMNYWQASDMLGNHNLSMYVNYNSGSGFLNYQLNYSYAGYRMPIIFQTSGLVENDNPGGQGLRYDKRYYRHAVGTAYPFDRYNRLEFYLIAKNERDRYTDIDYTGRIRTRAAQGSYIRDTVNGLYLMAVRGSRTELSYIKAGEVLEAIRNTRSMNSSAFSTSRFQNGAPSWTASWPAKARAATGRPLISGVLAGCVVSRPLPIFFRVPGS
jgi:hypothetical protein